MCFFILQLVALPDDHEVNFSTPIPRVCYDIPGTDPAICPATQYGLPRNVNILTYPVFNTTWDMDANIAWFPPPLPGPQYPLPVLYYVDISNQIFFKTNATVKRDKCSRAKIILSLLPFFQSIVITGLNTSLTYQVSVSIFVIPWGPYLPCFFILVL